MKKLSSFVLILFALFGCVLFSACGNKYEKLKMSFINMGGNSIEQVELLIDEGLDLTQNIDRSKMKIGVKFSGIKTKDVGKISVAASNNKLEISNIEIDKKLCTFDVQAVMGGGGEITVIHNASGKKQTISYNIEQKCQDIQLLQTEYLVTIGSGEHIIDVNSIIKKIPSDATDKIKFLLSSVTVPNNVGIINDGDYITGFNVGENVKNEAEVVIYPVVIMDVDGYDPKPYVYHKIKIRFVKQFNDLTLTSTDSSYQFNYFGVEEPLVLIANDESVKDKHRFDSFPVDVKIYSNVAGDTEADKMLGYYNLEVSSLTDSGSIDTSVFVEKLGQYSALVLANNPGNYPANVQFKLVPKFSGNLQEIVKILKVKVEEKPTDIKVLYKNEPVDTSKEINIFNFYQSSSSAIGVPFEFAPLDSTSYSALKTMRIKVLPSLINAQVYKEGTSEIVGTHEIYKDGTFSETLNYDKETGSFADGLKNISLRNNINVLQIYKYNQPLKFYYENDYLYSESITEEDVIYIKYEEINKHVDTQLAIDVETFYVGNEEHLKNIDCVVKTLKFNSVDGVTSVKAEAGHILSTNHNAYIKYEGSIEKGLYLNILDGVQNPNSDVFYLNITEVLGENGTKVSMSEFKVSVVGGNENPLKLFVVGDATENLKEEVATGVTMGQNLLKTSEAVSTVIEKYTYKESVVPLAFMFNAETDIGNYVIKIEHESNDLMPVLEIPVTIYKKAESNDFEESFDENLDNFKNVDFTSEYKSGYIVANGSTISLDVAINPQLMSTSFFDGYVAYAEISSCDGVVFKPIKADNTEVTDKDVNNYIKITNNNDGTFELNFKKSTHFGNTNYYISLYVGAEFISFSDIVTKSVALPTYKLVTFFVYEKVEEDKLSINHTSLDLYYNDTISNIYYEDKVKADVMLEYTNSSIWDYIQNQGGNKVRWYQNKSIDASVVKRYDEKVTITSSSTIDVGMFTLFAEIKQFNRTYTRFCNVMFNEAILTQYLSLTNEVERDSYGNMYLDLEVGGSSCEITAKHINNNGQVSEKGVALVVLDSSLRSDSSLIVLDNKIIVPKYLSELKDYKLLVLSKDLLKVQVELNGADFSNILDDWYLIPGEGSFQNAYVMLDLYITDGETKPYIINDADDFWAIANTSLERSNKKFVVMNDIDLSDVKDEAVIKAIENFSGSITTHNNQKFTLSGLKLDNNLQNVIKNLSGTIENLVFEVEYNYQDVYGELGLIKTNNGTLKNVSVEMSGSVNVNNATTFGGLVAINIGKIEYTTTQVGVFGNINLSGKTNNVVNFGGLVGENQGKIIGFYSGNNATAGAGEPYVFVSSDLALGSIANLNVTSTIESNTVSIGLVCGLNSFYEPAKGPKVEATIKNAYIVGSISHSDGGNVGGVVGKNHSVQPYQPEIQITGEIEYNATLGVDINYLFTTIKSAVTISGGNANVGGLVGLDINGRYEDCHYQILPKSTGINGGEFVGGLVGSSEDSIFSFCSVMSYNWNYGEIKTDGAIASAKAVADIKGKNVGGFAGIAKSSSSNFDVSSDAVKYKVTLFNYCSANAYIYGEDRVAGMIGSGVGFAYNAYFMGRMEADTAEKTYFGETIKAYMVYTKHLTTTGGTISLVNPVSGEVDVVENAKVGIDPTSEGVNWKQNKSINGGLIYISKSGSYPIFDLAPDEVKATVKYTVAETVTTKGFNQVLGDTIHLNYYEFKLDTTANDYLETLSKLNNQFNTHTIEEILDIEVLPADLRNVQLTATSARNSILTVIQGNILVVKGTGETTLTISSVLDSNKSAVINVSITLPVGDVVISSVDEDEYSKVDVVNIAKGKAQILYATSTGYKQLPGAEGDIYPKYYYNTNKNISLKITIASATGEVVSVGDYITITGAEYVDDYYKLDYKIPLTIGVKECYESGFNFSVVPYIEIAGRTVTLSSTPYVFNLYTKEGATDISCGHNEAIIYPNDTTYITAYVSTDINMEELLGDPLTKSETETEILGYIRDVKIDGTSVDKTGVFTIDPICEYNETQQIFTVRYAVNVNELIKLAGGVDKLPKNCTIEFQIGAKIVEVKYLIYPQRINDIDVTSYIYLNNSDTLQQMNVVKQEDYSLFIIDMTPYNGYYEYLEITDVTGGDEIMFQQRTGAQRSGTEYTKHPQNLNVSEGRGIRLYKPDSIGDSVYVRAYASETASSSTHTLKVKAFGGGLVLFEKTIYVELQMLPSVKVEYLAPDGKVVGTYQTGKTLDNSVAEFVAHNTITELRVTAFNTTKELELIVEETYKDNITWSETNPDILLIDTAGIAINSEISLKFIAKAESSGSAERQTELAITLTVANFVIYDVTVSPHPPENENMIYGNYGTDVEIVFSLEHGDYSYDRNASIHSNDKIKTILNALNNLDADGKVLVDAAGNVLKNNYLNLDPTSATNISLTGNVLMVNKDNQNTKLNLDFKLNYNSDNGNFELNDAGTIGYNKQYDLQFITRMSPLNMEVISSEEEFLNMANGDAYYILGVDLEFDNYVPLDKDIKLFDGNGRTITINSFAPFVDENVQAGLFKQVRDGMVVMNINVVYNIGNITSNNGKFSVVYSEKTDIAPAGSEVQYKSVTFGGIAAENNGVITNCNVSGNLVLKASKIDATPDLIDNYKIPFNVGGIVGTNTSTGYITHSTTSAKIVSKANIGGIVHTNSGKIASCLVDLNTNKGLIYAYQPGGELSVEIEVGGFAVDNRGLISLSAVEAGITNITRYGTGQLVKTMGNLSAKDESAGFIFRNRGTVKECYTQIELLGDNQNNFAGFVYENNNVITSSYSYVNKGKKDNTLKAFAPEGTGGISDCIEIIADLTGYTNSVVGVKTISTIQMLDIEEFRKIGLAFGDNNGDASFVMNGLPKIVSILEKVEYKAEKLPDISGDIKMYYGLRNYKKEKVSKIIDGVLVKLDEDYLYVKEGNQIHKYPASSVVQEGNTVYYEVKSTIELNHGAKSNPYVIYDVAMWDMYFDNTQTGYTTENYYRIVKDLVFDKTKEKISTSAQTFNGNLQGNNMTISGLSLNSLEDLTAIGLFKELIGTTSKAVENVVRNLDFKIESLVASKTSAVGVLAGIAQDFKLFNISLTSSQNAILGRNAVGGIVGIARGLIDVDKLSSDAKVTSTSNIVAQSYSIYNSVLNGKELSENIDSVYYAGSVIGIVDGYKNSRNLTETREITSNVYANVRNTKVQGDISIVGDTVGGAFGFIGEYTYVKDVSVVANVDLAGNEYSGGVVGENRGVIENATFKANNETAFERAKYVGGGIVGLNLGGLVMNAYSDAVINLNKSGYTAGGIIGRNIDGYVIDSSFNGTVFAEFIGGIMGSHYSHKLIKVRRVGHGIPSLTSQSAIQTTKPEYKINNAEILNLNNLNVGINTLTNWIENLDEFYSHELSDDEPPVLKTTRTKALGVITGLIEKDLSDYDILEKKNFDVDGDGTIDSTDEFGSFIFDKEQGFTLYADNEYRKDYTKYDTFDLKIGDKTKEDCTMYHVQGFGQNAIMYLVSAEVSSFDAWIQNSYLDNLMVVLG